MIAASLRLVAALRGGAQLAGRPRSQVAHLYRGKTTPSGLVPMRGRTVCRARTRRLSVLGIPSLEHGQRRVCRRCLPMLPAALGRDGADRLATRGQVLALYGDLTVADLTTAGRWCQTLDESHQVGFVAGVVVGRPKPKIRDPRLPAVPHKLGRLPAGTAQQRADFLMHVAIEERRAALRARERTDEERAEVARQRDIEDDTRDRISQARRDELRRARLKDRADRGGYLRPDERELLRTA